MITALDVLCGDEVISYMLALYRIHFPCESRNISSGVFHNSLGEMPHFIGGELPCTSFCVNYAEIGDLVFLKYYVMNFQNSQLFKRYFSKQKSSNCRPFLCVCFTTM
jgi:hypothetical protein